MRKIVGDEFSFFGNGDNTLLPADIALLGSAPKPADPVSSASSAPSFSAVNPGGLPTPTVQFQSTAVETAASASEAGPSVFMAAWPQPSTDMVVNSAEELLIVSGKSVSQDTWSNPEASAGLHINLIADANNVNAPAGWAAAVQQAAAIIEQNFSDPVTINLRYGYASFRNVVDPKLQHGGAFASGAYANTDAGTTRTYSTVSGWLSADRTTTDDFAAFLPGSNASFPGAANSFYVANAQLRALGQLGNNATIDGSAAFGADINLSDLVSVALHELTHAMGRITLHYSPGATPVIADMFRYDSAGHFQWTEGNSSASPSYFSIDGGTTRIADFGTTSDYSDWLNSGTQGSDDPFNEFYNSSTLRTLTTADIRELDALGFNRVDDFVQNHTTTGTVAVNGFATGNLTPLGDHDWFRVQLTAGVQYTIDERGQSVGAGTLSDPLMALYNTAGQFITSNDNGGGSLNSRIVYTPTVTGSYYIDAGAYQDQGSGTYQVSVRDSTLIFAQPTFQFAGFGTGAAAGGWGSDDRFPRELADVNDDHRADIVGFGNSGVYVALATGGGAFGATSLQLSSFGPAAGGWSSDDRYPRELADVNHDGNADIVGFGDAGVWVALATGSGSFGVPTFRLASFGPNAGGWSSDNKYPRELADVDHDGIADIVGFGDAGVWVALGTGSGSFGAPTFRLASFGPNAGGWSSQDKYPRELADLNGDGMADIVGFGDSGVYVALATGGGNFGAPTFKLASFGPNAGGWSSNDQFPRELADVNLDGKIDIVGFGQAGVYVAPGNGDGTFKPVIADLHSFGPGAGGWSSEDTYPRHLADVSGDGAADIVGFGQAGVYEALSNGFHLV